MALIAVVLRGAGTQNRGLVLVALSAGVLACAAFLMSARRGPRPPDARTAQIAALISSALVLTSATALAVSVHP